MLVSDTNDTLRVSETGGRDDRRAARLGTVAYEQIRAELMQRGQQAFDGRLVEDDIAAHLSLSRTPVREAMQRLHVEGWVEKLSHGGFTPRRSRMRDLLDVFELRMLLEPLAAGLAAELPAARLELACLSSPEYAGVAFHLLVAGICGNNALESAIQATSQICVVPTYGGGIVDFAGDHAAIAHAINRGDSELAGQTMVAHLNRVKENRVLSMQAGAVRVQEA